MMSKSLEGEPQSGEDLYLCIIDLVYLYISFQPYKFPNSHHS